MKESLRGGLEKEMVELLVGGYQGVHKKREVFST